MTRREDRYLAKRQRETLGDIDRVRRAVLKQKTQERFDAALWVVLIAVAFAILCKWSIELFGLFGGMFR